jgi:hypothetical protein
VPELVTVAVSYADAPVVSVPAHGALVLASNTEVLVVVAATTLKGSQGPGELVKLPLLEVKAAWKL